MRQTRQVPGQKVHGHRIPAPRATAWAALLVACGASGLFLLGLWCWQAVF